MSRTIRPARDNVTLSEHERIVVRHILPTAQNNTLQKLAFKCSVSVSFHNCYYTFNYYSSEYQHAHIASMKSVEWISVPVLKLYCSTTSSVSSGIGAGAGALLFVVRFAARAASTSEALISPPLSNAMQYSVVT